MTWRVLFPEQGGAVCLQRLALRCGYRISEICAELRCSDRYLREVFMRDIGLSPKEWMRQERMVVARRMLAGGRSPDEVAECLGFAVRSTFRREFVQFYQVRPLEFQREMLGIDGEGEVGGAEKSLPQRRKGREVTRRERALAK